LASHRGRLQLALRNQVDNQDIVTDGITTPQLIKRVSSPKPMLVSEPVRRVFRQPDTVEIIRGDHRVKQEY
jgi:Flp pilus assembly protein CpaB